MSERILGAIELKPVLAGRYRLDHKIAEGGFGVVYKGTQLNLDRPVAVKVISSAVEENEAEAAKERFMLEAATLARLVHPNVVTIHDYGQADSGDLFIVMEYLDGHHLDHVVQLEGPLAFRRIVRIAVQISRALRAAHAAGVVHRDLKPANVMLVRGDEGSGSEHAKVLDFGLVKMMDARAPSSADLTQSNALLGTPKYMAPEQICGEVTDARADLYSLGCVLYYLAAGVPPFDEDSKFGVVQAHLTKRPPPFADVGYHRACPPVLERVIMRCLEKAPADRHASVDDLIGDLKHAYLSLPAEASEAPVEMVFDSRDLVEKLSPLAIRSEITNSGWHKPDRPLLPASLALEPPAPRREKGALGVVAAAVALLVCGGLVVFSDRLMTMVEPPAPSPVIAEKFATLRLESTPPGAHVFLNGEPTGQLTPARLEALPIGARITVRLEMKGRAPFMRELVVQPGSRIQAALEPISGEPAEPENP